MAASFRSTCDSNRGRPEFSTQRLRAETPHVGHGMEAICLSVSAFFFKCLLLELFESEAVNRCSPDGSLQIADESHRFPRAFCSDG